MDVWPIFPLKGELRKEKTQMRLRKRWRPGKWRNARLECQRGTADQELWRRQKGCVWLGQRTGNTEIRHIRGLSHRRDGE